MAVPDPARKGDPEPTDDPEPTPEPQGDTTDWKAEARKWEARAKASHAEAKANADAAKRLKEMEDADKSEVQRANEAVAAAEKRANEAEAKALRAEIAAEKGLTLSQAKRLIGSTREELEADADELLEAFKAPESDDKRDLSRKPKEKLRPGASADPDPAPSGEDIAEKVLNHNAY